MRQNAPSPELRQAISTRIAALDLWTAPKQGDDRQIIASVGVLMSAMAGRNSGQDAVGLIRLYAKELSNFPAWAVETSCNAFLRAEIGDGKWLPTPGEIIADCRERVVRARREQLNLQRIIDAKVVDPEPEPTPESKARIAAQMASLRAKLSSTDAHSIRNAA